MTKTYKRYRKGIRAVIYKKSKKGLLFLVLHRVKRWRGYELLKGGKLSKETFLQALKREIKEETACRAQNIKKLSIIEKFDYPLIHQPIFKRKSCILVCYICEISCSQDIKLGDEHDGYKWLDFKKALKILTHKSTKKVLRYTNSYLKNA